MSRNQQYKCARETLAHVVGVNWRLGHTHDGHRIHSNGEVAAGGEDVDANRDALIYRHQPVFRVPLHDLTGQIEQFGADLADHPDTPMIKVFIILYQLRSGELHVFYALRDLHFKIHL